MIIVKLQKTFVWLSKLSASISLSSVTRTSRPIKMYTSCSQTFCHLSFWSLLPNVSFHYINLWKYWERQLHVSFPAQFFYTHKKSTCLSWFIDYELERKMMLLIWLTCLISITCFSYLALACHFAFWTWTLIFFFFKTKQSNESDSLKSHLKFCLTFLPLPPTSSLGTTDWD